MRRLRRRPRAALATTLCRRAAQLPCGTLTAGAPLRVALPRTWLTIVWLLTPLRLAMKPTYGLAERRGREGAWPPRAVRRRLRMAGCLDAAHAASSAPRRMPRPRAPLPAALLAPPRRALLHPNRRLRLTPQASRSLRMVSRSATRLASLTAGDAGAASTSAASASAEMLRAESAAAWVIGRPLERARPARPVCAAWEPWGVRKGGQAQRVWPLPGRHWHLGHCCGALPPPGPQHAVVRALLAWSPAGRPAGRPLTRRPARPTHRIALHMLGLARRGAATDGGRSSLLAPCGPRAGACAPRSRAKRSLHGTTRRGGVSRVGEAAACRQP